MYLSLYTGIFEEMTRRGWKVTCWKVTTQQRLEGRKVYTYIKSKVPLINFLFFVEVCKCLQDIASNYERVLKNN